MKRITLIYDFLKELGGLERMMFFHANCLSKRYNTQLLFSYVSDEEKERIIRELELNRKIPILQISKVKNEILQLSSSLFFPTRIMDLDTDLIISYSFMSSRMAYEKKKRDGTPYIVVMCHPPNFLYSDVKGWANTLSRFLAKLLGLFCSSYLKKRDIESVRNADLVLSISNYTAKRIHKIYGVKSEIVYPQLSRFFRVISEGEKTKFLSAKNIKRPFLLAHGRIIPDKNYEILFGMLKELEGYDLIISGTIGAAYKKELESKIRRLGMSDRIKILGRISREDLLGYYNAAEIFLMPAPKEDFGMTMTESIACGCPVIAWGDNAGPNEIITTQNGFLAKPYNRKDFLKKIKEALRVKWDRNRVAQSVKKFSEERINKVILAKMSRFLN